MVWILRTHIGLQPLICLRLEKNNSPNGSLMVMNPMVESKRITLNKHKQPFMCDVVPWPWFWGAWPSMSQPANILKMGITAIPLKTTPTSIRARAYQPIYSFNTAVTWNKTSFGGLIIYMYTQNPSIPIPNTWRCFGYFPNWHLRVFPHILNGTCRFVLAKQNLRCRTRILVLPMQDGLSRIWWIPVGRRKGRWTPPGADWDVNNDVSFSGWYFLG